MGASQARARDLSAISCQRLRPLSALWIKLSIIFLIRLPRLEQLLGKLFTFRHLILRPLILCGRTTNYLLSCKELVNAFLLLTMVKQVPQKIIAGLRIFNDGVLHQWPGKAQCAASIAAKPVR